MVVPLEEVRSVFCFLSELSTSFLTSSTMRTVEARPVRMTRSQQVRASVWKTACSGGK